MVASERKSMRAGNPAIRFVLISLRLIVQARRLEHQFGRFVSPGCRVYWRNYRHPAWV